MEYIFFIPRNIYFAGSIQAHLQYPHTWVRLVSSQLFGFLFASWPPSELVAFSREGTASRFYITDHLPSKVLKTLLFEVVLAYQLFV